MDKTVLSLLPINLISEIKDINILEEIRIRIGKRILLKYIDKEVFLDYKITKYDMEDILEKIFKGSRYSYQNEIVNGFVTIEGGHRIGITGSGVIENNELVSICNINSLNIRISKNIEDVSCFLDNYIVNENRLCTTLIVSAPGMGKTTILKDLIRRISDGKVKGLSSYTVGVVDERMELSSSFDGENQTCLGEKTDVITNINKDKGMKMLIRSMAPEVLVVDEIGTKDDVEAIKYGITSGIKGIFTAHGDTLENLLLNPIIEDLIKLNIIERIIVLDCSVKGKIYKVYKNSKEGYIKV